MTDGKNDTRLEDFMSESRELGRELAQGKDALPKWALKVARAAADGVISLTKDQDGEDDIARAYADLMKSASKKAVHEHTTGGIKANVSKARQIAIASTKPTCDFVDVLNRAVVLRQEMQANDEKVKPAYAAFVEAARTQNEQDDDLSDDQLAEALRKKDPAEQTEEKILERVEKALGSLIEGDKGVKSNDPRVHEAHGLIKERLAALTLAAEIAETTAKAQALGLIPTPPAVDEAERAAIEAAHRSNERAAQVEQEAA
jgi:hypothetical protein